MDYTSIQRDVYNAIKEAGTSATINIATKGTYSPVLDTYSTNATNYSSYVLVTKSDDSDSGLSSGIGKKIGDNVIKTEDKLFVFPAYLLPRLDAFLQNVNISIISNGKNWRIQALNVLEPGGVALMYKANVKLGETTSYVYAGWEVGNTLMWDGSSEVLWA